MRRFKVVVITDRKDLQRQLSGTATLTGETVEVADSTTGIQAMARRKGPGLIFATIQKYRDFRHRRRDTADGGNRPGSLNKEEKAQGQRTV